MPFPTVVVSIDLTFVNDYLIAALAAGQLIDTRSGDMIFVAIALKHKLVLVSEDARLLDGARSLGVIAMDADTYVSQIQSTSA